MELRVKGRDLVEILSAFVGNNKVMFNFLYKDEKLNIQILEDYTAVTNIDCELVSGPVIKDDVSFWVTNAVLTLLPSYDIVININDVCVIHHNLIYNSIKLPACKLFTF